jgi:Polyketide cyclase / dehydrase and lipid transport
MLSFKKTAAGCALAVAALTNVASAQAPAPAAGAAAPTPMYFSFPLEITVNKPAAEVWARVGKYCDIQEWLGLACTLSSGKEGEFGAVRSLNNGSIQEIIVGRTAMSYTYAQPVRPGRPYDMYHGTLEAQAITPTTTKLLYTLVVDEGSLADDAAREADKARRATQFKAALDNMKILAEGGTLPPRQGRGGGGQGKGKQ